MLRRSLRIPAAGAAYLLTAAVSSSAMVFAPDEFAELSASSGTRAGPGTAATRVIAHRGASRYAPENTLAAVDAAHRRGFIWVENDVQRSKDGRLVVLHDTTLRRTTDAARLFPGRAPWRVGDFTAAEIARLDAGSWFGKRFKGERVPTLADYLRRLDHNGQRLLLEIKAPEKYPGIEAQVLRELRARGWLDHAHVRSRLVIQSFCVMCVKTVHELAPQVRTGILGAPDVRKLAGYARFADQINPRFSALSSRWLAAVHRLRGPHGRTLEVYAWDVAKNTTARSVRARGVEGVIE
ncbi:glycerophosphodiester phosphodiesterase [Streptomyces platensis]|uniref:Glycerophosphodiester phosphodiesterase n=1 Tax=Streptomyces platensis TaxID=58346 RepID=A0AAE6NM24_STRPT|nr:glycerophosphodiester phosphodiesterase family protein [Streptomyces platensis]OSY47231.1 Glycerophosphoryl diester phosphodiesterase [Streptomyces platensis]QEV53931.1 glycerophosphodiester phosphodiesterase [Streptomyces platensis]